MSSSLFSNFQGTPASQTNSIQMAAEKMKPMVTMYKMFQASQNPMGMLQEVANSNDNFKAILNQTQSANGNPQQAFYAQARQNGLSDEQIESGLVQLEQILGIKRP